MHPLCTLCAPQRQDEHPSALGICTHEHSWWLESPPSSMPPSLQGISIRTPNQGARGRENQLQSWVSSSGSVYGWGLCPLLTLAAVRLIMTS